MSYREVEVEVMVGDKAEPYTFNVDNINYYRTFSDNSGDLKTMIYLKGSVKGIILNIGYNTLKSKLQQSNEIYNYILSLSPEEFNHIKSLMGSIEYKGVYS